MGALLLAAARAAPPRRDAAPPRLSPQMLAVVNFQSKRRFPLVYETASVVHFLQRVEAEARGDIAENSRARPSEKDTTARAYSRKAVMGTTITPSGRV